MQITLIQLYMYKYEFVRGNQLLLFTHIHVAILAGLQISQYSIICMYLVIDTTMSGDCHYCTHAV